MPGKYYKFDKQSLQYKSENPGVKQRLGRLLKFLGVSLIIAILITVVFFRFWGFPKMHGLQKENKILISKYQSVEKNFKGIDSVLAETQIQDDSIYRVIVEIPPLNPSIREGGFGGADRYRHLENLDNAELVTTVTKTLDVLSQKARVQLNSYNDVLLCAVEKEKMLASLPALSPLPKDDIGYISDYFGYRDHPIYHRRLFHYGVDLTAEAGTEIHAPGDGIVEKLDYASPGYGRTLLIDHGFGFKTLYGHLSKFNVKKGDTIKRGDVIAFVGNVGISSGSHLHYEIIKDGRKINPFNYFTIDMDPEEYFSIISH